MHYSHTASQHGHDDAGLTDKKQRTKAERIAFDLIEYLDQIDYNKYYEAMGQAGTRGGEREKLYSDFSSQSIKAAQVSLFLLGQQLHAYCFHVSCQPMCHIHMHLQVQYFSAC